MLLSKDEINKLNIIVNTNKNKSNVQIYLNNNLIHNEKLYILKYQSRINKIKKILSFWK